jgi:hypothetical protein
MPKSKTAKPNYAARRKELSAHTDQFCADLLNDEYRDMCRTMVKGLCLSGSPGMEGDARLWAAAVVAAIGQVNFLDDKSFKPFYTRADLAKRLGYSYARLKKYTDVLVEGFDLQPFDLDFTLPSMMKHNPLVTLLASPKALFGECCGGNCCGEACEKEDCCQKPKGKSSSRKRARTEPSEPRP